MKNLMLCLVCLVIFSGSSLGVISVTVDLTESLYPGDDTYDLSAQAIFTLDTANASELQIELINTSGSVPSGFDAAMQLLTSISFDLGASGINAGDPSIESGVVVIGAGGYSINFDNVDPQLVAGEDVSGEWGYGNSVGADLLANFVTAMASHATPFGGGNLDGPAGLDGPQGGISTDPALISLGGLGSVTDSVMITLDLSDELSDLDFLDNGVVIEFGSDAAFVTTPEPLTILLLGFGSLSLMYRRRR